MAAKTKYYRINEVIVGKIMYEIDGNYRVFEIVSGLKTEFRIVSKALVDSCYSPIEKKEFDSIFQELIDYVNE